MLRNSEPDILQSKFQFLAAWDKNVGTPPDLQRLANAPGFETAADLYWPNE